MLKPENASEDSKNKYKEDISHYRDSQIKDTKIIRSKESISKYIAKPDGINVLEIGTGSGDYADHICSETKVINMTIADTFEGYNDFLGRHDASPAAQKNFVSERLKDKTNLKLLTGRSINTLPELYREDRNLKYDFIYIDASHAFEDVIHDIFWATMLLNDNGIIGIDDYCFPHPDGPANQRYEVQQAVSSFLQENPGWRIKYFSFHANGFQNIFLCKDYQSIRPREVN